MPTISGLRNRGYTPESLKSFALTVGISKRENVIDVSLLEFCVRTHLNEEAPRAMAVLDPLKISIINYNEKKEESVNFDITLKSQVMEKERFCFQRTFT